MNRHVISRLEHGRRWHTQWAIAISRYIASRHPHDAHTSAGWVNVEL